MKKLIIIFIAICLLCFSGKCTNETGSEQKTDTAVSEYAEKKMEAAVPLKKAEGLNQYSVNYYDSRQAAEYIPQTEEAEGPLEMVAYGPQEKLPAAVKRPSLFAAFSQPIVPISKLGTPQGYSELMKISPPLKGVFRWYGTRLLSFDADEDVLPQREYTVTLSEDLKSLQGKILQGKNSFSFRTEYLKLESHYRGKEAEVYSSYDVPPEAARKIWLKFNYAVNPDIIQKYISIYCNGTNYRFDYSRPPKKDDAFWMTDYDKFILLSLHKDFPENSKVLIKIAEGARSEKDYLGNPEAQSHYFTTLKPFTYQRHSSDSWNFPKSEKGVSFPLYLHFSHPLKQEGLRAKIITKPEMPIKEENFHVWGKTILLTHLPVNYEMRYRVLIDSTVEDIYGRRLGKTAEVQVKVPSARSYSYFPNTGSKMLEAQFPPKVVFEFQNIDEGFWKVGAINNPYSSYSFQQLQPFDFSGYPRNERAIRAVDLAPYLNKDGKGWVGLSWHFDKDSKGNWPKWRQANLQLQVTDLGLTLRYGYNKIIGMVSSLSSGEAVAGANITLANGMQLQPFSAESDKNGFFRISLEKGDLTRYFSRDAFGILVQKDADKILYQPNFSHNHYHFGISHSRSPFKAEEAEKHCFLFTDRGLYKPGETLTFRGIDRNLQRGKYSNYTGNSLIKLYEPGWRGKLIEEKQLQCTDSGGFYGQFKLSDNLDPGRYVIKYSRFGDKEEKSITFQIAHFRRTKFQVQVKTTQDAVFLNDSLSFAVDASYLSGGELSGGSYDFYWKKERSYFRPSGEKWENWRFGPSTWDGSITLGSGSGKLQGDLFLKQETSSEGVKGAPYTYSLEVQVSDAARQQIAARASQLVHPASVYLGLKEKNAQGWWSYFMSKGSSKAFEYAVVDHLGNIDQDFSGKAKLRLIHKQWKRVQQKGVYGHLNTRYEEIRETEVEKELRFSGGRGDFSINPKQSGSYELEIEGKDAQGRTFLTQLRLYVSGSDWVRWYSEDVSDIELVADRDKYMPGETARFLVKSPLPEGQYLLSIEREGILEEKVIKLEGSSTVIEVPVREDYLPLVYVSLSSWTKRSKKPDHSYFTPDLDKPKGVFGIASLFVDTAPRMIDVDIINSKDSYLPGNEAEVLLQASINGKAAANVELCFLAVDRGVVDLIDYHVPDPLAFFYSAEKFPLCVRGGDSRSMLIDPVTYEVKDLQGGDGADDKKMKKRKDFSPTAVFKPFLKTDEKGRVSVRFKLPDTLTTYRCTAIAVKNDRFGRRENELYVRNPINMRTALPRKMRPRDSVKAGVLLSNRQKQEQKVSVSLKTEGLFVEGDQKKSLTLAPGETCELRFLIYAKNPGQAKLTFTLNSSVLNEELENIIEIERPWIYETFTTTGIVDDKARQEGFLLPRNIEEERASLNFSLASTRLGLLAESIRYLEEYPYQCMEQRSAKIWPYLLFGNNMQELYGIEQEKVNRKVQKELDFMVSYQLDNGGFPFWPGSSNYASPYVSCRIALVLAQAEKMAYSLPSDLDRTALMRYLNGEAYNGKQSSYLRLMALYALAQFKHRSVEALCDSFWSIRDNLGIAETCFLGLSLASIDQQSKAKSLLTNLKRYLKPGTRSLDLTSKSGRPSFYGSQVEELSLLAILLQRLDPENIFYPLAINTLLSRQKSGYWYNTADTFWAISALYHASRQELTKGIDFNYKVKLDNIKLMDSQFSGLENTLFKQEFSLAEKPLDRLKKNTVLPLVFEKKGQGSLYYTTSFQYGIPAELIYARDEGFSVYSEILSKEGEKIDSKLKAGETYTMKVVLSSPRWRDFAVLRVPVPAGAEILDSNLVTTARPQEEEDRQQEFYWYRPGPVQKLFDLEARYYFDRFWPGQQEVSFRFRTTSSGIFPTPPVYAECMYEPEVFGRTAGKLYRIED